MWKIKTRKFCLFSITLKLFFKSCATTWRRKFFQKTIRRSSARNSNFHGDEWWLFSFYECMFGKKRTRNLLTPSRSPTHNQFGLHINTQVSVIKLKFHQFLEPFLPASKMTFGSVPAFVLAMFWHEFIYNINWLYGINQNSPSKTRLDFQEKLSLSITNTLR